jgi:hypothetical protein
MKCRHIDAQSHNESFADMFDNPIMKVYVSYKLIHGINLVGKLERSDFTVGEELCLVQKDKVVLSKLRFLQVEESNYIKKGELVSLFFKGIELSGSDITVCKKDG